MSFVGRTKSHTPKKQCHQFHLVVYKKLHDYTDLPKAIAKQFNRFHLVVYKSYLIHTCCIFVINYIYGTLLTHPR